eukprot:GDKI01015607.1.p1 GENE.GDKI01015607.1~~GDKI01015607.1.p1  ORF type:complete len:226 (-),score=31.23 GDKI01015607.1:122-799(-)
MRAVYNCRRLTTALAAAAVGCIGVYSVERLKNKGVFGGRQESVVHCAVIDKEVYLKKKYSNKFTFIQHPSGFQYRDLRIGRGEPAKEGDLVRIHYEAKTADGTPIESTYRLRTPKKFYVGSSGSVVVPAIDLGVRGMCVGGRRELVVPPSLGYGDVVRQVLLYDIEVMRIGGAWEEPSFWEKLQLFWEKMREYKAQKAEERVAREKAARERERGGEKRDGKLSGN